MIYSITAATIVIAYFLFTIDDGKYRMPDASDLFAGNYIRYQRSATPCHKEMTHDEEHGMKEPAAPMLQILTYFCPKSIKSFFNSPYSRDKQHWFRSKLKPTFKSIYQANSVKKNVRYHALIGLCASVDKWDENGIPFLAGCIEQISKEIRGNRYSLLLLINLTSYNLEDYSRICSYLPEFSLSVLGYTFTSLEWKLYCRLSESGNSLIRQ